MNIKQIVMNMLRNNGNPIFNNLMQMAEKNDTRGLEEFARNYCKERGCDFDKEMEKFQNMISNNKK